MKKSLISFVMICLAGLWIPTQAAEQTKTFIVEKMTCALCPVTVKKAIEKVDGVTAVNVNFEAKTATVTFDDEVATPDAVAWASTNAGYPASLVQKGS